MLDIFSDEYFMKQALVEAQKAYDDDEIPVGAIIVSNEQIIARAHNQTERLNDFTAHAEMLAITAASEYIGAKYLNECSLYVTLEPCIMCAGACYWSKMGRIVFGAFDQKNGYGRSSSTVLHPKTKVTGGIMENEASELLKTFFLKKR